MHAAQLLTGTCGAWTPFSTELLAEQLPCLPPCCHVPTCPLRCLQYLQSALTAAGATPVPQPQLNLTFLTTAAQLAYPNIVQVCVPGVCMLRSCAASCCT